MNSTWNLEDGNQCFPAPLFQRSLLQAEINEGVVVPYIQNETKEKKTKNPRPKPPGLRAFSQAHSRGGRAFVVATPTQSLRTQPSRVLWSGISNPIGTGASGMRLAGFALPSPGRNHWPSHIHRVRGRALGSICAPPREAHDPAAGILGMLPPLEASGRPLGRGRGPTWNFSSAFCTKPP